MRMLGEFLKELLVVCKTTLPLILLLLAIKLILNPDFSGEWVKKYANYLVGIVFVLVGLTIFTKGINTTLVPLGDEVASAFIHINRPIILVLCFVIGFTATLVEPALKSIADQVYEQTQIIKPAFVIYSTAVGVSVAMVLGVSKVLWQIKTGYIIVPMLVIVCVLCILLMIKDSQNHFMLSVAFDCAGATTGPVNIPINAAIAIGLAMSMGLDPMRVGFGLVGITTLGAATSVMVVGLLTR